MLQQPMFAVDSEWSPPDLNSLPDWSQAKRIGLDTETCDPGLRKLGTGIRRGTAYIAGISFCLEDDPHGPYYLPVRHLAGGNLDYDQVFNYLRDNAARFRGSIVGANLNYDMDHLLQHDVDFYHCDWRDIQVADPLIDELHMSYSMENISERWGIPGKDETLLRQAAADHGIDPKSEMWKLHSKYVGAYAEQDALLPLQLLRKQERVIEEKDLWQIYDLERAVQPVLLKMRRYGVRIDQDKLTEIERWTLEEETEALKWIKWKTGVDIGVGNVWKPKRMAPALQAEGIILTKTNNNQWSITAEILDQCGEIGEKLKRARKVNKIRTTFAASIRAHMVNGRIHCSFHQMRREKDDGDEGGVRYGRLSCSDPNLQQQPSADRDPEIAGEWRKIYIPDDDGLWLCADYSQQEPRWLTHFAELTRCTKAKEAADRYRNDPDTDNHDMMTRIINGDAEVDKWLEFDKVQYKAERTDCKQIYLGKCYGMGGPKFANKLGLPTAIAVNPYSGKSYEVAGPEAQAKLDKFDREAPYVSQLATKCERRAKSKGVIITVLGRHCHFPKLEHGGYDWTHKALNRLIQGSSADQMKKALVLLDQAGHLPMIQVHDEVNNTVHERKEVELIGQIMREAVPCNVPHKIDLEVGPNWGNIKDYRKVFE